MSDVELFQALRYLPDLEMLAVYWIPLSNEAAQFALIDSVGNSILCPKLKKLTWYARQGTCSVDIIASVLCARWDHAPFTLEEVNLKVSHFTVQDLENYPKIKLALDSGAVKLNVIPTRRLITNTAYNPPTS